MFLIDDILMSPVNFTVWLVEKIKEQAQDELYDVEALKGALDELQKRHEAGEISDQEFLKREERLLKTLQEAREFQKAKAEGLPAAPPSGHSSAGRPAAPPATPPSAAQSGEG